jgi:hypothetical protein
LQAWPTPELLLQNFGRPHSQYRFAISRGMVRCSALAYSADAEQMCSGRINFHALDGHAREICTANRCPSGWKNALPIYHVSDERCLGGC